MSELIYATSNKHDGNLSVRLESEEVVAPRREAFLSKHNVRAEDCVYMETEHRDTVMHVGNAEKGKLIPAEAFITKEIGLFLYLLTADCFPVSFYDSQQQVIALAHMGWRPTNLQLATKVIEEMKSVYNSKPQEIKISIGPGIHKESYTFKDHELKQTPEWKEFLTELPNGDTQIDLIGNILQQIIQSGVPIENTTINPIDTATSSDYFSHYRSVRTGEAEGRFATIVGMQ
jgi:YfiH family protein